MNARIEGLLGDPLYQVNLLLWMLQPSAQAPVQPLLHGTGYRLRWIEVELPLPLELKQRLARDGIEVRDPASPDLLIQSSDNMLFLIECKRSMFGADLGKSKDGGAIFQARALLLQAPPALVSAIPALSATEVHGSRLLYLARCEAGVDQTEGLRFIAQHLRAAGYPVVPFGFMCLATAANQVVIRGCNAQSGLAPQLQWKAAASGGSLAVQEVEADTDPRPLYLIPWMPGSEPVADPYSRRAFGNRILAASVVAVGLCRPPCHVEFVVDVLLKTATCGISERWRNKSDLRITRDAARRLLRQQLEKVPGDLIVEAIDPPAAGWRIGIPDDDARSRIIETLRTTIDEKWDEPPAPTLFDGGPADS